MKNKGAQAEKLILSQITKAISTWTSSGKRMHFWTFTDASGSFRWFRRVVKLIHMYPATESCRSESVDYLTVFIRRAPLKHNTASECIRTVAATYGCKILQPYKYDAICE